METTGDLKKPLFWGTWKGLAVRMPFTFKTGLSKRGTYNFMPGGKSPQYGNVNIWVRTLKRKKRECLTNKKENASSHSFPSGQRDRNTLESFPLRFQPQNPSAGRREGDSAPPW